MNRRTYQNGEGWLLEIAMAISSRITWGLTAVITVITTIFVIAALGWFAYVYLPLNVFRIVLAIVAADILLGIAVRAYLRRHR